MRLINNTKEYLLLLLFKLIDKKYYETKTINYINNFLKAKLKFWGATLADKQSLINHNPTSKFLRQRTRKYRFQSK